MRPDPGHGQACNRAFSGLVWDVRGNAMNRYDIRFAIAERWFARLCVAICVGIYIGMILYRGDK